MKSAYRFKLGRDFLKTGHGNQHKAVARSLRAAYNGLIEFLTISHIATGGIARRLICFGEEHKSKILAFAAVGYRAAGLGSLKSLSVRLFFATFKFMTIHISARLAWHNDGWNGRVCQDPAANVYCIGRHSYPGEMIADKRDLEYEKQYRGECCSKLDRLPPCIYSINAFGNKELEAFSDPPSFFKGGAERQTWRMKASTICVWPYEEMYQTDCELPGNGYDYDLRLEKAKAYFSQIESNKSLIVYYANYSNPLNQDDDRRYAVVGLSRIKEVAPIRFYDQAEPRIRENYGGGFIWQCDITSHYPDEGFRLPYHLYRDDPDKLAQFAFFPDNPRLFKFATRAISDDDMLDIVEHFLEITGTLQEMGDRSEDWSARAKWLQSLIGDLWSSRGLYPGMAKVLDLIGFAKAIPYWKEKVEAGSEKEAKEELVAFLEGRTNAIQGVEVSDTERKKVSRQWQLRGDDDRALLRDVIPRFDLRVDQIERIMSDKRENNCVYSTLRDIYNNPYLLSEQYKGDDPDDIIPFNKIDHGIFPSPELGGESLAEVDDSRRLRGLCVEHLHRETKHTFVPALKLIHDINHRLSFLPQWKSHQFTERYFEIDQEDLLPALVFRQYEDALYIYLRNVYEAEREIERQIRTLADRSLITFKSPVTEKHWTSFLTDVESPLYRKAPEDYGGAITGQVDVCSRIFAYPLAVIAGGAGTGKTTVIKAIIKAIEKAHGSGTSFQLLAPTGKATDRIRAKTGKPAITIHSFLARLGWLNQNMTLKLHGGKREESAQTIIVDESSMLDLEILATLVRAINWNTVQRLILVGDPSQLPPIGRGKCFAELIGWLQENYPDCYAELHVNIRQMENRISDQGQGILDLAAIYQRSAIQDGDEETRKAAAEDMLRRLQEGGDVDKDLRAVYWSNPEELADRLIEVMVADMEADTGKKLEPGAAYKLWSAACEVDGENGYKQKRADYNQVLTPYRGELYGTEALNTEIQKHIKDIEKNEALAFHRSLDGITIFDKVIQITNRPKSRPIHAYNTTTKQNEPIEIFNGELGFVRPHGLDGKKWKWSEFQLRRFQVQFARKENHWVGYGSKLGKNSSDRWIRAEKVEENLELAYAISVHKSQGSEFDRVYLIVPKHKATLLSPELFYTGITRASRHCTLLIEEDITPLLEMRRRERSHLVCINSSVFDFAPIPELMLNVRNWYEENRIHETLSGYVVRSKSEVIIANMLAERGIPFTYEEPLFAPDGTFYLPDFTITWRGEHFYWEHWGRLDSLKYRDHADTKRKWYTRFYTDRLVETVEGNDVTTQAAALISQRFT